MYAFIPTHTEKQKRERETKHVSFDGKLTCGQDEVLLMHQPAKSEAKTREHEMGDTRKQTWE